MLLNEEHYLKFNENNIIFINRLTDGWGFKPPPPSHQPPKRPNFAQDFYNLRFFHSDFSLAKFEQVLEPYQESY